MSDDQFDTIEDLFAEEEEEVETVAPQGPGVFIALPGADSRYVNVIPGMNVGQILDAADITLRATDQTILVDGVEAGLDTVPQAGSTITAYGRAKGG